MKIARSLLAAGFLLLFVQQALADSSPFIDNMPPLGQDPDRAGAMIWQKPDLDRSAYTRVMIEPITIFISPDSEYQGLDADALKQLAAKFQETVTRTLEPEIPTVYERGPGVAYVRAALTNVKLAKKKRGLLSYTPIGLVVTAATSAGDANISLKDAVLEVEMLDSMTGERLGVLVDKAPKAADGDLSWEAINETLGFYARRLKARMEPPK